MALFEYKARGKRGDAIAGTMDAASSDAVAASLMDNDLTPITINPAAGIVKSPIKLSQLFVDKIRDEDIIQFSRQMYSLTKAGVPILDALAGLSGSTKNPILQKTIGEISSSLEAGQDLATSFAQFPKIFSVFYISMIRVGETSGKLDWIFLQLAKYMERDKKTRNQIKSALRYPMFVIAAIFIAIIIINIFVIPTFADLFKHYNTELPWATQVLLFTSNLIINHWLMLFGGTIAMIMWVRYFVNTERGRYLWDKKKMKLPLVGELIHQANMARFARLFSLSTKAGVPLITTLTVVGRALDNTYMEERVLGMQSGIERGESISRTASATGMFDSLVLQMMTVGEASGALEELLDEIADYYESEVDYAIDKLSAAIEPILTIVIGFIVLVLALGVFLPMWSVGEVALHKTK